MDFIKKFFVKKDTFIITSDEKPYEFGIISGVRAYWEALRQPKDIPSRNQLSPRGISHALENVFLIELDENDIARIRISGSKVNAIIGEDSTGMPVHTMFLTPAIKELELALAELFGKPSIVRMNLVGKNPNGDTSHFAKLEFMPLRNQEGQIRLALGVIESEAPVASPVLRYEITSLNYTPIEGIVSHPAISKKPVESNKKPHIKPFIVSSSDPKEDIHKKPISYIRLVKS